MVWPHSLGAGANGPTTGLLGESRIAAEEEVKVATYCREAILARAMPEPELPDVATLPAWVIHFLIFLTRGKTRPAMPIE